MVSYNRVLKEIPPVRAMIEGNEYAEFYLVSVQEISSKCNVPVVDVKRDWRDLEYRSAAKHALPLAVTALSTGLMAIYSPNVILRILGGVAMLTLPWEYITYMTRKARSKIPSELIDKYCLNT